MSAPAGPNQPPTQPQGTVAAFHETPPIITNTVNWASWGGLVYTAAFSAGAVWWPQYAPAIASLVGFLSIAPILLLRLLNTANYSQNLGAAYALLRTSRHPTRDDKNNLINLLQLQEKAGRALLYLLGAILIVFLLQEGEKHFRRWTTGVPGQVEIAYLRELSGKDEAWMRKHDWLMAINSQLTDEGNAAKKRFKLFTGKLKKLPAPAPTFNVEFELDQNHQGKYEVAGYAFLIQPGIGSNLVYQAVPLGYTSNGTKLRLEIPDCTELDEVFILGRISLTEDGSEFPKDYISIIRPLKPYAPGEKK